MIIILGILSIFQLVFIPGFIFLNLIKFKTYNKIETSIFSFSISLFLNYFFVFILSTLAVYKNYSFFYILFIEISYLIYLFIKNSLNRERRYLTLSFKKINLSFYSQFLLFISIMFLLYFIYLFLKNFFNLGSVFIGGDAIVSWNRWAVDWALNLKPIFTIGYAQLIPANWSISYVLINNTYIPFFAKSIMPIFSISILLGFLNLFLKNKKNVFLVSLIIFAIITLTYNNHFIADGHVDIASSFFGFLSLYIILDIKNLNNSFKKIIILFIICCSAFLVKLSGSFILIATIIWFIWFLFKNRLEIKNKKTVYLILIIISMIFFSLLSYSIIRGNESNLNYLTNTFHGGRNYFQRFLNGFNYFTNGPYLFFLLVIFTFFSFYKNSKYWIITITLVFPYIIIWGFFFSYDERNLTFVYPLLSISASAGIVFIVGKFISKLFKFQKNTEKNEKILKIYLIVLASIFLFFGLFILNNLDLQTLILKIVTFIKNEQLQNYWIIRIKSTGKIFIGSGLVIIFSLVLIYINKNLKINIRNLKFKKLFLDLTLIIFILLFTILFNFKSNELYIKQIEAQKHYGNYEINNLMLNYKKNNEINGKILTDYPWISIIPEFRAKNERIINSGKIIFLNENNPFSDLFDLIDKGTIGMLISDKYFYNDDFNKVIKSQIKKGNFKLIFQKDGYNFIIIN